MLNIHQGFYSNIGPLKNKSLLLNYKNGKILVKAPIGTGKSFLFFDGPIYALYKSNERTIINKDSKEGEIQLLFSVNDSYFLVVRKLKPTKSGSDSAKTYLYSILKDKNFIDYLQTYEKENIVLQNNDILTLLNFYQVQTEDLTTNFKQEKELQENLNDLLPPKEVALSTIFLPQSSENIFELTPSARINILKQVFGILGIDEAKKIIDEKKREITGMIKAKEDTSSYKEKFDIILEKILEKRKKIENYSFGDLDEFIKNVDEIGEDLFDINLDKITTLDIDFDSILKSQKNKQEKYLKEKQEYQTIQSQLKTLENEKNEILKKLKNIDFELQLTEEIEKKKEGLKIEIKSQKLKIEKILEKQKEILGKYDDLQKQYETYILEKNEYKNLQKQEKELEEKVQKLQQNLESLENEKQKLKSIDFSDMEKNLESLKKELEEYKNIDFEKFTFNNKKVSSFSELAQLISSIETEGKNLKSQIDKEKQNLENLKKEIESLENEEKKGEKKVVFNCEKIGTSCPFIKEISNKILGKNDFIKKQILEKKQKYEKMFKEIEKIEEEKSKLAKYWKDNNISKVREKIKQIEEKEKQYNDLVLKLQKQQKEQQKLSQIDGKKQELEKQIEEIKNSIETTKQTLTTKLAKIKQEVGVEDDYKNFQKINKDLEKENEKLLKLNEEIEKVEDKQNLVKTLLGEKKQLEKQLEKLEKNISNLEKKIEKISLEDGALDKMKEEEKNILDLKQNVISLNDLITDYNKNKLSLMELKHKFSLYKDLSNIFGKELVIYVFLDYLESLEELINYFIQDVVNFRLNIKLDEKGENLDIFVEDEKGKRDVKSLSGGQKTALRIGWILGISKLQNSKLLFLDETINNFDQQSIEMIARKIKEFIEENDMKFYMITHSEILQQADIWTDVVELKK